MHFSPYKNGITRESGQGIGIGLGCLLLRPIWNGKNAACISGGGRGFCFAKRGFAALTGGVRLAKTVMRGALMRVEVTGHCSLGTLYP